MATGQPPKALEFETPHHAFPQKGEQLCFHTAWYKSTRLRKKKFMPPVRSFKLGFGRECPRVFQHRSAACKHRGAGPDDGGPAGKAPPRVGACARARAPLGALTFVGALCPLAAYAGSGSVDPPRDRVFRRACVPPRVCSAARLFRRNPHWRALFVHSAASVSVQTSGGSRSIGAGVRLTSTMQATCAQPGVCLRDSAWDRHVTEHVRACVRAGGRAGLRACVRACVHTCVCAGVRACGCARGRCVSARWREWVPSLVPARNAQVLCVCVPELRILAHIYLHIPTRSPTLNPLPVCLSRAHTPTRGHSLLEIGMEVMNNAKKWACQ